MPYWNRRRDGITFVFKSDPLDDKMAHIWTWHPKDTDNTLVMVISCFDRRDGE